MARTDELRHVAQAELKAKFSEAVADDFVSALGLSPPNPFSSPLRSRAILPGGEIEVVLAGTTQMQIAELIAIGYNATAWCVAGMALVLLCMVCHMRSWALACLGMVQILAALPIALFVYSLAVPFTGARRGRSPHARAVRAAAPRTRAPSAWHRFALGARRLRGHRHRRRRPLHLP